LDIEEISTLKKIDIVFIDENTSEELMKNITIIRAETRLEYYNALDKAHTTNDYVDFSKLVAQEVEKSLDMYLKLI